MNAINQKSLAKELVKRKNFFMVSNRIFEFDLKPKDFTVYCCLVRHCDNDDHSCFPSRKLIAKECGIDKKTVDAAMKNLENRGLVKKIHRKRSDGSKRSNLYYVSRLFEEF